MKKNKINPRVYMFVLTIIILVLGACQKTTSARQILFDTGRGVDAADNMTYVEFESLTTFTLQEDITIRSIYPQINYCNGSCGYIVQLIDQHGQVLASQTGWVDAEDQSNPSFSERYLSAQMKLAAQTEYLVFIRVWSTESVGIYTTGDRTSDTTGVSSFTVNYARSDLLFSSIPPMDNIDRGSVAFQFVY